MKKFKIRMFLLRHLLACLVFLVGLTLFLAACGGEADGSSPVATSVPDSPLTSDKQFVLTLIGATAPALRLSSDQLQSRIQAHQSLAEIAQAQHIEVDKVRQALLSSARTQLNTAVKDGKLTQTTADQQYQTFAASTVETLIATHFGR